MIPKKFRSIKNGKIYPTWPYEEKTFAIVFVKDLCKSLTMLFFTMTKAALNLTKSDMKKQNQSS